jgi:hypothetical protein
MTNGDLASKSMVQRALFPFMLLASLLAALVYFVGTTTRTTQLGMGVNSNLLGTPRSTLPAGRDPSVRVDALAGNPLDQRTVNGVIAAHLRQTGDARRAVREAALLRDLGWRNTSALQNLLWRGVQTSDVPLLMDTIDALLRREKLLGEIYPVLNAMTTEPTFRGLLIRRLAARPPWRRYYFQSASDLSKPDQIEGRYLTMRAVQRSGDRLTRNEIAPILPKLIGLGRTAEAFALWQTQAPRTTTPLADLNFAVAALPVPYDSLPVPFEWQLASGSGFFADAGRDARGSFMSIHWSGRGAPTFATQRTSGRAGRYRLQVVSDEPATIVTDRLGFRLSCASGAAIPFVAAASGSKGRIAQVSASRVSCNFPELQLYGLTQTGLSSASIVLRSVRLQRIG